jgi:hypothetical protein
VICSQGCLLNSELRNRTLASCPNCQNNICGDCSKDGYGYFVNCTECIKDTMNLHLYSIVSILLHIYKFKVLEKLNNNKYDHISKP